MIEIIIALAIYTLGVLFGLWISKDDSELINKKIKDIKKSMSKIRTKNDDVGEEPTYKDLEINDIPEISKNPLKFLKKKNGHKDNTL